jgi:hypothetical protein
VALLELLYLSVRTVKPWFKARVQGIFLLMHNYMADPIVFFVLKFDHLALSDDNLNALSCIQGRRNTFEIGGAEFLEAPPWLAPSGNVFEN